MDMTINGGIDSGFEGVGEGANTTNGASGEHDAGDKKRERG